MKGSDEKAKIRISVIGGKQVGKTALTVRYLTKRFIGEYNSNSDMVYHQILPGNPNLELEIVDISTPRVPLSEVPCDGIILTYSITDKSSFEFATQALSMLSAHYSVLPPVTLVANKCDLVHVRAVEREDGVSLASKFGIQFYELSVAENSPEVQQSFSFIVNAVSKPPKRRFSMSRILRRFGRMSMSPQKQHSDSSSESSFDGSSFPCPRISTFNSPQKRSPIECS